MRLTLPTRPQPGDLLEVAGGPTRTVAACEVAGRIRFTDGTVATWRLEREVA